MLARIQSHWNWWECKNGTATLENSLQFLVKHTLTYDPAIPFIGISIKKSNLWSYKNLHTNVYNFSIITPNCKKPKHSSVASINK